ncbi:nucleotidyl transferase AbiEii/AbiGii toxin family protein [Myceligenerans cantabricum]
MGYPDHMVLAEKIVTAVERGTANTRRRDLVDVAAVARTRYIRQSDLAAATSQAQHLTAAPRAARGIPRHARGGCHGVASATA